MRTTPRPLAAPRSLLSVPASSGRFLTASRRTEADALMFDLEDGVAAAERTAARATLDNHLRTTPPGPARWLVRVDDPLSDEGRAGLALAEQHRACLAAVVVPKATVTTVGAASAGCGLPLIALVETGQGVEDAALLARHPRVHGIVFGELDYLADLSDTGAWHVSDTSWARGRLVNAAAAGGVWALAGPTTDVADGATLLDDVRRERASGFAGKLVVHPGQVAAVNDAFAPGEELLAWARRVLDAVGGGHRASGALRVDGHMVDRPVLGRARRVLAEQRAWSA